jgi:hypothetical protein
MSKKLLINSLLIFLLLGCYFGLWVFNQRLNYRKVLTLNTKLSLNSNTLPGSKLSSPTYVLRYLLKNQVKADLSAETVISPEMSSMARRITTKYGSLEVYEFENSTDVLKQLKAIQKDPLLSFKYSSPLMAYRNLLIYNQSNSKELGDILVALINEDK